MTGQGHGFDAVNLACGLAVLACHGLLLLWMAQQTAPGFGAAATPSRMQFTLIAVPAEHLAAPALRPQAVASSPPARHMPRPPANAVQIQVRGQAQAQHPMLPATSPVPSPPVAADNLTAPRPQTEPASAHPVAIESAPAVSAAAPPIQQARPDHAYSPRPDYPSLLREQGIVGTVWLKVKVETDGQAADVQISRSSGYRLFDDAASRAVQRWRFIPARRGETRLASWVEFAVRFTLDD